jgi:hypothetical protein
VRAGLSPIRGGTVCLVALVALAVIAVAVVISCSGKEGTCSVAPCGAVQPVSVGFLCTQQPGQVPPYATYATIARTTVNGPCAASCSYPEGAIASCEVIEIAPTDAGTCRVEVTSSADAAFALTYLWTAQTVSGCPGCATLDLADAGSSPYPFVRDCDGGRD